MCSAFMHLTLLKKQLANQILFGIMHVNMHVGQTHFKLYFSKKAQAPLLSLLSSDLTLVQEIIVLFFY